MAIIGKTTEVRCEFSNNDGLVRPIYSEAAAPVLGPATRPATGSMVVEIMRQQKLHGLYVPPAIAEQLLQEPGGIDYFRGLDFLCYAGGPLSPAAGDLISQVTDICTLYGSTETGQIHQLVPLREDWAYLEWHPSVKQQMQPSDDDAYELVIFPDASTTGILQLGHNFPNVEEWRTRDLFKPHPVKPHLWRFHGRRDDIIVLSNGEKFNPVPMEALLQGHPLVSGALVIGQGRFQAALLIEPKPDMEDTTSLAEEIWSHVEQGNLKVPGQGRISRSKVMVLDPSKSFQRAGKGTIVRKLTERLYEVEIEALYGQEDIADEETTPLLQAPYDLQSIRHFVRANIVGLLLGFQITNSDDLFVLGLDSLKTVEVASLLKAGLKSRVRDLDISWISSKFIYAHPSIDRLSLALASFLNSDTTPKYMDSSITRTERMGALVERHTKLLPQRIPQQRTQSGSSKINVALTGSTGSLGSHILRVLLKDSLVSKIYCLDRTATAPQRHKKMFADRGIAYEVESTKVRYLSVSYGQQRLGLKAAEFAELIKDVDVIVHNAWKVDFNHSLESFEEIHIRGVRNLIEWSISSEKSPRIVFVSSVSSVANWNNSGGETTSVPEKPLSAYNVASEMGYGESKNVAEHILGIASGQSAVPASILRVGQIAGSTVLEDSAWPVQEWVPSLIKTSISLGFVPDTVPPIDWIPVNELATIIVEFIHADRLTSDTRTYNLVNPRTATWAPLLDTIQEYMGPQVKVVPLAEWISKLEQPEDPVMDQILSKPALKILDFFKQFEQRKQSIKYETEHSVRASRTMADLKPVNRAWMEIWLKQWNF